MQEDHEETYRIVISKDKCNSKDVIDGSESGKENVEVADATSNGEGQVSEAVGTTLVTENDYKETIGASSTEPSSIGEPGCIGVSMDNDGAVDLEAGQGEPSNGEMEEAVNELEDTKINQTKEEGRPNDEFRRLRKQIKRLKRAYESPKERAEKPKSESQRLPADLTATEDAEDEQSTGEGSMEILTVTDAENSQGQGVSAEEEKSGEAGAHLDALSPTEASREALTSPNSPSISGVQGEAVEDGEAVEGDVIDLEGKDADQKKDTIEQDGRLKRALRRLSEAYEKSRAGKAIRSSLFQHILVLVFALVCFLHMRCDGHYYYFGVLAILAPLMRAVPTRLYCIFCLLLMIGAKYVILNK